MFGLQLPTKLDTVLANWTCSELNNEVIKCFGQDCYGEARKSDLHFCNRIVHSFQMREWLLGTNEMRTVQRSVYTT